MMSVCAPVHKASCLVKKANKSDRHTYITGKPANIMTQAVWYVK